MKPALRGRTHDHRPSKSAKAQLMLAVVIVLELWGVAWLLFT